MQKFVVKKISRSTNITLGITEDQSLSKCANEQGQLSNLESTTSVRMCGYLKKKRNRVGGWKKMYFVLQNSLLMSYNSKEEYEKKLVSFKDVICLIPNNTVLIPSLEQRFTIASNQNTLYTFRCEDNRTSKWISAILECLSRDTNFDGTETNRTKNCSKLFSSQQNLSHDSKPIFSTNHSWENLPINNWIVNHNGRILLELNYINCNRAKLPIGAKTAKILQKYSDDVISVQTTAKKVEFIQNDENQNFIRNDDHDELVKTDHFRLHNAAEQSKQSKEMSQISKIFRSESQRPGNSNGNDEYSEIGFGLEEQIKVLTLGDEETGEYSSVGNYQSVDSKRFNNKLNIENTEYAEIEDKFALEENNTTDSNDVYATVDFNKKREERLKKNFTKTSIIEEEEKGTIYEDICNVEAESIYELIDIPLRPSRKTRSLVWKNWSRLQLFDTFTKRFKETPDDVSKSAPSLETINKRHKTSLTSDLSKSYRSVRNKARKMYRWNNSSLVTSEISLENKNKISSS